jgi:hypothetical protein
MDGKKDSVTQLTNSTTSFERIWNHNHKEESWYSDIPYFLGSAFNKSETKKKKKKFFNNF